jgi:hypothetical protein
MASSNITAPDAARLLTPLLPALPAAAVSTQPATAILPLLSPILRQRVQLLSSSSTEPWLRLLCYDAAKAAKLAELVHAGRLEPHPVSGEFEVDWDSDAEVRYRRLDRETLQSLFVVPNLGIGFQLIHCVGDKEGGEDGWRVGEVTVADAPSPFSTFGGRRTIDEAEMEFEAGRSNACRPDLQSTIGQVAHGFDDDDDDDSYWGRYDATPARSPAIKRSPAPQSTQSSYLSPHRTASAEDAYYAQYDSVQPAMDNHDPDEEVEHIEAAPPLGLGAASSAYEYPEHAELNETNGAWTLAEPEKSPSLPDDDDRAVDLIHPRPASSASSNGSQTVAKLEETAGKQEQNEFGVKQHVSRSIRSLYLLSRASGIDREEFERLVRTELDVLGIVEDQE